MSTPSLYEMLTFSFSGELPLEQVSERDQLILSVMDNMQRIINCRAYCFFNIEPERLRQSGSDFSCLPFILIMAICSAGSSFPFAILAFVYSLCL